MGGYLGLGWADAGQKVPDSTGGDAACRADHLGQGLGTGRRPVSLPASHPLKADSILATRKPQPVAKRIDRQYIRSPSGCWKALTTPGGLQPVLANLLHFSEAPYSLL